MCEIYELWLFDTLQYDPVTQQEGLFSEYMREFLKLKQEASGWPEYCIDEESKAMYIAEFAEKEGIQLDPLNIEVNPSKRNLAKLCANSLWGKMVQRPVHQGTEIFSDLDSFHEFVSNEGIEINNIIACEEKALVSWKYLNTDDTDFTGQANNESVSTGVYTTALARIKLYRELEQIDPQCLLYCDTDSIIYVEKPDSNYVPKIGTCIGDLTDEITAKFGPTAYAGEFVSTAPKTYALRIKFSCDSDKCLEIAKCKGYMTSNQNVLSFDRIKSLLDGESISTLNKTHINRTKSFNVVSKPLHKEFRFSFNKRACLEENKLGISSFDTVPYGYI